MKKLLEIANEWQGQGIPTFRTALSKLQENTPRRHFDPQTYKKEFHPQNIYLPSLTDARKNLYDLSLRKKWKTDVNDETSDMHDIIQRIKNIRKKLKGNPEDILSEFASILEIASKPYMPYDLIINCLSTIHEKPQRPQPDTGTRHPQQMGAEKGSSSNPEQIDISSEDEA